MIELHNTWPKPGTDDGYSQMNLTVDISAKRVPEKHQHGDNHGWLPPDTSEMDLARRPSDSAHVLGA